MYLEPLRRVVIDMRLETFQSTLGSLISLMEDQARAVLRCSHSPRLQEMVCIAAILFHQRDSFLQARDFKSPQYRSLSKALSTIHQSSPLQLRRKPQTHLPRRLLRSDYSDLLSKTRIPPLRPHHTMMLKLQHRLRVCLTATHQHSRLPLITALVHRVRTGCHSRMSHQTTMLPQ